MREEKKKARKGAKKKKVRFIKKKMNWYISLRPIHTSLKSDNPEIHLENFRINYSSSTLEERTISWITWNVLSVLFFLFCGTHCATRQPNYDICHKITGFFIFTVCRASGFSPLVVNPRREGAGFIVSLVTYWSITAFFFFLIFDILFSCSRWKTSCLFGV